MFDFKDNNKKQNIQKVKELLESLLTKIPQLKSIEIGIDFSKSPRAMDMSIYTKFDTKEDLNIYANHKEHLEVVKFIKEVTVLSKVVDYIA
jgi:hypothetical protein